jgi:hypothetical protein
MLLNGPSIHEETAKRRERITTPIDLPSSQIADLEGCRYDARGRGEAPSILA